MALVIAVAWILSLAWELPHAIGMAKKKKEREREKERVFGRQRFTCYPLPPLSPETHTQTHTHRHTHTHTHTSLTAIF